MILGLALLAPACSDPVAPPAPTPVTPTITETFNGTLGLLGTNIHLFSVQQVGGLTITISDINPDSTLSFAIGAQSLVGCTVPPSWPPEHFDESAVNYDCAYVNRLNCEPRMPCSRRDLRRLLRGGARHGADVQ